MSSDHSHWDLVVIGGARVGHEVAHAAASRSARVLLVVPGAGLGKLQAEAEGLDLIFQRAGWEWREAGCSM